MPKIEDRKEYEKMLVIKTQHYNPDIIVLAGWNHILSDTFLKYFPTVINLHPALHGTLTGQNCIERSFQEYKKGNLKQCGVMCHHVIEIVDKGELISQCVVPVLPDDRYTDFETRLKKLEKGVLLEALQKLVCNFYKNYKVSKKNNI